MDNKTGKFLPGLTAFLCSFFCISSSLADTTLNVGDIAPAFELIDQNGKQQKLSDYKGKWLVLYFYPKDDTPGCTREACAFRDDILAINSLDARILGISLDSQSSHKAFAEKYHLPFPLLADVNGEVSRKYGSLFSALIVKFSKRHSFIINPEGKIAQIYRDVDPDKHSKQIINDLTQLTNQTKSTRKQ